MRDPYAGLAQAMESTARGTQPAGMCLGRIIKIGKGVLEIQADNGLKLDGDDLLVNAMLEYDGAEEQRHALRAGSDVTLGVHQQVSCLAEVGPYVLSGIIFYDIPGQLSGGLGTSTTATRLKENDRVLMQPINDGQTYVVLCKVVSV